EDSEPALRPPAVPLVTHDPYFSLWSCADHLTDDATRHWTNVPQSLTSLIRIDGKAYRLMGREPHDVPALPQTGLRVLPTRTLYEFAGPEARVTLTFTTPALPDDLDLLARPVTYLTWEVRATDGKPHSAALYFAGSAEIAVNTPDQPVTGTRTQINGLVALRLGSEDQPVLQKKGDNLRIDWGYLYAAAPQADAQAALGPPAACAQAFLTTGELPDKDDLHGAHAALPVAAFVFPLGQIGAAPVSRYLMLAYDDRYAIDYFGSPLLPYWRRRGREMDALLRAAARDYRKLQARCAAFDADLMADLKKVGGEKYARLAALAYRQCLAGNKLAADANGQPLLFPKENTSNGCIGTVDVIYPMAPLFLLFSPTLAKASLAPVLTYAASPRWEFPFAPHDLGTYPRATGQVYGGGERTEENQMPVEESGNMILLLAAIAKQEGSAQFASRYWPQVTQWAEYLEKKGFDPENQLCTDDFTGHLAHNANLSIKAIEALAAYGLLCEMRGEKANAARYRQVAREMAAKWTQAADDGDHFRLAFDRPGTWSQKYNLVWDRLLGLNLFPAQVAQKEMAFYRTRLNRYGLPLDNRQTFAKTDWALWTATLADSRADFEALVAPVYDFLNATPDRVPFSDFYWTKEAKDAGMHARPVIGGVFIKMLSDPALWKKWAKRDKSQGGDWAALPPPPRITEVVPSAQHAPVAWRYTTEPPAPDWFQPDFDASGWKEGPGGFGTRGTPGAVVRTEWKTADIWLRREFTLPAGDFPGLQLLV
ncbi:MAG TPA: DUF4965 domain-containing protein, partial [Chthonomonadaceae bacterium]|nr:DUF4965 domain-containing protein [Chthonomonadaceae bacterium]